MSFHKSLTKLLFVTYGVVFGSDQARAESLARNTDDPPKGLKIKGDIGLKLNFSSNEDQGDAEIEADLKVSSRRSHGWKAEIAVEGESDDRQMRLKEALANWSSKSIGLSMGLIEKNLGMESHQSKWDRHFDSLIYRKFKESGLVGEELGVSLYSPEKTWTASLGLPESKDYNLRVAYNAPIYKNFIMPLSAIVQSDYWYQGQRQTIYAATVGLRTDPPDPPDPPAPPTPREQRLSYELEVCYGIDPSASEWSKIAGNGGLTYFSVVRSGLRVPSAHLDFQSPLSALVALALIEHRDDRHRVVAGEGGLGLLYLKDDWQLQSQIKRQVDSYRYPDYKTQSSYDWIFDLKFLVRL